MKKIDNLIKKLKKGNTITTDECRIVGYLLDECRDIERNKGNNFMVEMSPQMYKWYVAHAYNAKGEIKSELDNLRKIK